MLTILYFCKTDLREWHMNADHRSHTPLSRDRLIQNES